MYSLFSKYTEGQDKHWIRLVDANHAVVTTLIDKDDIVAEHQRSEATLIESRSCLLILEG